MVRALCVLGEDASSPESKKKRERETVIAKRKEELATKTQDVGVRIKEEEGRKQEGRGGREK